MRRTVLIFSGLLLALCWQPVASWGQDPTLDASKAFVTRWRGEAGKDIEVPLYGYYAYRWEKADGTEVIAGEAFEIDLDNLLTLPVPESGEYVLKAGPSGVKRIEFGYMERSRYIGSCGTPEALLEVVQWGSVAWESFAGAFMGCKNMRIAKGAGKPDLSGVRRMNSAFCVCSSFNSPVGDWDVSRVESMRGMFSECGSFNQPLEKWDVSKVTDMEGMFASCSVFNQPLEKWDVSSVENMGRMFARCSAFNQPLGKWDVSSVENMEEMFSGCRAFNQPLGGWTLSSLARDEEAERFEDLGLGGSGLDVANYSATLSGWAAKRDKLKFGVKVRADGLKYNAAGKAARQRLVSGKGWAFFNDREASGR